jgi:hypothetical protein
MALEHELKIADHRDRMTLNAVTAYHKLKNVDGVDQRELALFRTHFEEAVQHLTNAARDELSPFDNPTIQ